MKFSDIKNALRHITKTTKCLQCKSPYEMDDVNVVATTQLEGLFEMHCNKCHLSSIMTVSVSPAVEIKKNISPTNNRMHKGISSNDILDVKNFLNNFDGNFKKLFPNEK